jgi:acetyltransferase-like isoleucine patch superfamily enzyme
MENSNIVQSLLFCYEGMSLDEITKACETLPKKIVRWLGSHHPDNKTRKKIFEITGVEIGEETVINQNFIVSDNFLPLLKIGKRVAIAPNVTVICDSNPNNSQLSHHEYVSDKLICQKNVVIEDDAWIGANVVILPGVTIGKSSIIAAGAIVTKDVQPYTVVAGNPAKVLKTLE